MRTHAIDIYGSAIVFPDMFSQHNTLMSVSDVSVQNKLICDLNQSNEDSYKPWCIEDVSLFILPSKLGYDINQCKLVSMLSPYLPFE